MSQSSFLVAMLIAGFLFYLAAKGRLGSYTAVLWGDTAQAAPSGGGGSGGSSGGSGWIQAVQTAAEAAAVIGA